MAKKRYSVLLLRPAHVADGFGTDTYWAQVQAESPTLAIRAAQLEVANEDGHEDVDPVEYEPLVTVIGWRVDLTPAEFRQPTEFRFE